MIYTITSNQHPHKLITRRADQIHRIIERFRRSPVERFHIQVANGSDAPATDDRWQKKEATKCQKIPPHGVSK